MRVNDGNTKSTIPTNSQTLGVTVGGLSDMLEANVRLVVLTKCRKAPAKHKGKLREILLHRNAHQKFVSPPHFTQSTFGHSKHFQTFLILKPI